MKKSERAVEIVRILKKFYATKRSHLGRLGNRSAFKVLIGTMLSHRTRDAKTDLATEQLFAKYDSPRELARAPVKEIEKLIKPVGFYRVKARRVKQVGKILVEKFGGRVPHEREQLMSLPGVGAKTAGCVIVYGFGKQEAIPVDAHLFRIANKRIGLTNEKTPEDTEQALMKIIPKQYWIDVNEVFVLHGQNVCKPLKPLCFKCPIVQWCDYQNKNFIH